MLLKIITIGKIKNSSLKTQINELKKRIPRLQILELKEIKEKNIEILKQKEFELINQHIKSSHNNILLNEYGKTYTTQQFYDTIKKTFKPTTFIITGAYGPNEQLKKKVDSILSLSKMTFTHEQAQYMLIEQLYRCYTIQNQINYNK